MTNETLAAHIRAYRSGAINIKDHADMVEELVHRGEREAHSREDLKRRFDELRDGFVAIMFDE